MGHNVSMEVKHVRSKVRVRVQCLLVVGELCFVELFGDRSQRGIGRWSTKKILIRFFFESFFCYLEVTNLFVSLTPLDGRYVKSSGLAQRT